MLPFKLYFKQIIIYGYIYHRVVHGSDGPAGRVGSGHDFAGFWRVGSGQHFGVLNFFTDYFLVPESIWIFEYYIRIDWFSTIFNKWLFNQRMYTWGKCRAAGRVGSGQTFCRQSRVGSGRVNISPVRVGSGPRKLTRGQIWYIKLGDYAFGPG